jgi:hypothetical protein
VTERARDVAAGLDEVQMFLGDLELAEQHELGVVGGLVRLSSGVASFMPGGTGWTSRGVTMTTSSVSFFWKPELRNRAPRIGTSPSHGIWSALRLWLVCSSPAMARLWPSRSSTVVLARRVDARNAAHRVGEVGSLTSGSITRLMTRRPAPWA